MVKQLTLDDITSALHSARSTAMTPEEVAAVWYVAVELAVKMKFPDFRSYANWLEQFKTKPTNTNTNATDERS